MLGTVLYPKESSNDEAVYLAQQKGTATHKIFELLSFDKIKDIHDVKAFIKECLEKEWIPAFWEDLIPVEQISQFCQSDLGRRMAKAEAENKLYRERPFVMGIPVKDVYPEKLSDVETDERILIQGIIDVFWIEEDGITLLDYKTDRVECGADLVKRYQAQMELYEEAINRVFVNQGYRVKKKILYSFRLNEAIEC